MILSNNEECRMEIEKYKMDKQEHLIEIKGAFLRNWKLVGVRVGKFAPTGEMRAIGGTCWETCAIRGYQ